MARIENVNIDGTDYDVGKIASTSNLGVVQIGDGLSITSAGVLSATSSGGDKTFFGRCSTAADTSEKVVSIWSGGTFTDADLVDGTRLFVLFTNMNSSSTATLKVDNGTAKGAHYQGSTISVSGAWRGNDLVEFVFGHDVWNISSVTDAGETIRGIVRLSAATNSTSGANQGIAATPSAVKAAYDLAASKGSGTITAVQANGTNVATSGTANIPAASTSAYGVTQLSSSTSSTSTTLAATPSAVKSAYDLANGKVSITLSTTDIGQGASLAANTLYGVYE